MLLLSLLNMLVRLSVVPSWWLLFIIIQWWALLLLKLWHKMLGLFLLLFWQRQSTVYFSPNFFAHPGSKPNNTASKCWQDTKLQKIWRLHFFTLITDNHFASWLCSKELHTRSNFILYKEYSLCYYVWFRFTFFYLCWFASIVPNTCFPVWNCLSSLPIGWISFLFERWSAIFIFVHSALISW